MYIRSVGHDLNGFAGAFFIFSFFVPGCLPGKNELQLGTKRRDLENMSFPDSWTERSTWPLPRDVRLASQIRGAPN